MFRTHCDKSLRCLSLCVLVLCVSVRMWNMKKTIHYVHFWSVALWPFAIGASVFFSFLLHASFVFWNFEFYGTKLHMSFVTLTIIVLLLHVVVAVSAVYNFYDVWKTSFFPSRFLNRLAKFRAIAYKCPCLFQWCGLPLDLLPCIWIGVWVFVCVRMSMWVSVCVRTFFLTDCNLLHISIL